MTADHSAVPTVTYLACIMASSPSGREQRRFNELKGEGGRTNVCERFLVRAPIPQMSRIDSTPPPFQVAPLATAWAESAFLWGGWLEKHG